MPFTFLYLYSNTLVPVMLHIPYYYLLLLFFVLLHFIQNLGRVDINKNELFFILY